MDVIPIKNKKSKYSIPFVFFLLFCLLLYLGSKKAGYHLDEILTYSLSNNSEYPFPYTNAFNRWLPKDYFYELLTVSADGRLDFGSVISNQIADVHPPIYYILIHSISALFPGVFSKWIGLSLNIIVYFFIILMIVKLFYLLTSNGKVSLFTSLFWGLSIGALNSVVFIRMYSLLTLWFLIFQYLIIKIYTCKNDSKRKGTFIGVFIVTVLGALTQYYFLIAAFFLSALLCLLLIFQKRNKELINFSTTMALALLTSWALFPPIIHHIFRTNRGIEAFDNISGKESHLFAYFNIINQYLFGGLGIYIIIIIVITFILYFLSKNRIRREKEIKVKLGQQLLLVLPAFLYVLLIQRISPYQTVRYIFMIFPTLIIFFVFTIYLLWSKLIKKAYVLNFSIFILCSIITISGFLNYDLIYTYSDVASDLKIVSDYKNNDALIVLDQQWRLTDSIQELMEFKSVYPIQVSIDNPILPDEDKLMNNDSLIVYIGKPYNQKKIINLIKKTYSYKEFELLYEGSNTSCYYFKK